MAESIIVETPNEAFQDTLDLLRRDAAYGSVSKDEMLTRILMNQLVNLNEILRQRDRQHDADL